MRLPIIGITTDFDGQKQFIRPGYAGMVQRAGGFPILLPLRRDLIGDFLDLCDGLVLTGGDDPIMEMWGVATHPKATKVHPDRQAFEIALLEALDQAPEIPVLGICLGMQLMALHGGGMIDQHLPESDPEAAARHWGGKKHRINGELGEGDVFSHHRQAIVDPGRLSAGARSEDGLIEAVRDPARPFYLGVQWHPERTADDALGIRLFHQLIKESVEGQCSNRAVSTVPSGVREIQRARQRGSRIR